MYAALSELNALQLSDGYACLSHAIGDKSGVLRQIIRPEVNLALWQRPALRDIVREVSGADVLQLADVRQSTSIDSFDADVASLLGRQGLDPDAYGGLRADLKHLAELFFTIGKINNAQFRLVGTDRDDCKRFHVDRKRLRMLCTYRGPGTEWLTDAQVDRVAQTRCAPNSAMIRYGSPMKFQYFWVGIMKGDPDNHGHGLVHRSPPIEAAGDCRVLFCMDC